jgi:sirohydrochlorin ferrochelatase
MRLPSIRWSTLALLAVFVGVLVPHPVHADSETAVLILAHGGSSQWNKSVKRAVKGAELPYPSKIFFGMGDTLPQRNELQDDIRSLESDGAHTIIVVPLLVSSFSEVARQWKYLLGMGVQAGFINTPLFPVEKHATIQFGEPLNDSAVVVEILLDRAHEISSNPAKESIIIVAHGPNDDADNQKWGQILQNLSSRVRERGGYASVEGFTLRDDAPASVRRQAVETLRSRVEAIGNEGRRALVVSLLLAPGGIENKIGLELRGLNYAFNTKTLLPDSRISEWIRSQVP